MAKTAKKPQRYTNLYVKRRLIKLEIDVFGTISDGILHKRSRYAILTSIKLQIRHVAVLLQLDQAEADAIWENSVALYNKIVKKTALKLYRIRKNPKLDAKKAAEAQKEAIYAAIRPDISTDSFISDADHIVRHYDQRKKQDELAYLMASSAKSPFYLCSSHPKPAKDHADWEGKMYYDEDWEQHLDQYTPDELISIRAYIRNHQLRTVQWVTGAPVYMIYRPNCKHYLKNIPLKEVLHASTKSLLKKHRMIEAQDAPVSARRIYFRSFYNRGKLQEYLQQYVNCPTLEKDLKHTRKYIDKWR